MEEVQFKIIEQSLPQTVDELCNHLREVVCVDPDKGTRRMPTNHDLAVFDLAADTLERLNKQALQLVAANLRVVQLREALTKQAEQSDFLLKLSQNDRIYIVKDGKKIRTSLRDVLKIELTAAAKAAREALDKNP